MATPSTTALLMGVFARIPRAGMLLRDLIIGSRTPTMSGNAKVRIQLYRAGQKLAPATTPAHGGVIMTHVGYEELEVEATYFAPAWDMTELADTRAPGEAEIVTLDMSGNVAQLTTADRVATWQDLKLREAREMMSKRMEWMLAKQLIDGTITIQGNGANTTIDVGFNNSITDPDPFDDSTVDPIDTLSALRDEAVALGVPVPNVLVVAPDVAAALRGNTKFRQTLLDYRGSNSPLFNNTVPLYPAATLLTYVPSIDTTIWQYGGTYAHPDTGATTSFIPSGKAAYFPSADRNSAFYAHGSIWDTRNNTWYAVEAYPREWEGGEGRTKFFGLDSRFVCGLAEAESWYSLSNLLTAPGS